MGVLGREAQALRLRIVESEADAIDARQYGLNHQTMLENIERDGAYNKDEFEFILHQYCRVYSLLQIRNQYLSEAQDFMGAILELEQADGKITAPPQ